MAATPTFNPEPDADFSKTMWEDFPALKNRAKLAIEFVFSVSEFHLKFSFLLLLFKIFHTSTFSAAEFRCTKNNMAHLEYSKNLKSRKFQPLTEDGFEQSLSFTLSSLNCLLNLYRTMGLAWNGFKGVTAQIEKFYEDLATIDTEVQKAFEAEHNNYQKETERIDNQFQILKKKRADAQDACRKVCIELFFIC